VNKKGSRYELSRPTIDTGLNTAERINEIKVLSAIEAVYTPKTRPAHQNNARSSKHPLRQEKEKSECNAKHFKKSASCKLTKCHTLSKFMQE